MMVVMGESHYKAKLTEDDVKEIRMDPRPQSILSAEYGVSQTQISRIKTEQAWKQVE